MDLHAVNVKIYCIMHEGSGKMALFRFSLGGVWFKLYRQLRDILSDLGSFARGRVEFKKNIEQALK